MMSLIKKIRFQEWLDILIFLFVIVRDWTSTPWFVLS